MKKANNFKKRKFCLMVLLSFFLIHFCQFQPGVAYKKKRVLEWAYLWEDVNEKCGPILEWTYPWVGLSAEFYNTFFKIYIKRGPLPGRRQFLVTESPLKI